MTATLLILFEPDVELGYFSSIQVVVVVFVVAVVIVAVVVVIAKFLGFLLQSQISGPCFHYL